MRVARFFQKSLSFGFLGLLLVAVPILSQSGRAEDYFFKQLHSFCSRISCKDGSVPVGGLENGFGVASQGGKFNKGAVFEVSPNGQFAVLHSFCPDTGCTDGQTPIGKLLFTPESVFGTTFAGGSGLTPSGTVFELAQNSDGTRTFRTIYNFCSQTNCVDGAGPLAALITEDNQTLYGTTTSGGKFGRGVLFKLREIANQWTETVVHDFCGHPQCPDGRFPRGIAFDRSGNIWGITQFGGEGVQTDSGVLFEFQLATDSTYHVLHFFCQQANCPDGTNPTAAPSFPPSVDDPELYGTTANGGGHAGGSVYRYNLNTGVFATAYSFCSQPNCSDGLQPSSGVSFGNGGAVLIGATSFGGAHDWGTLWSLEGNPLTEHVLHDFCSRKNCADGGSPQGDFFAPYDDITGIVSGAFTTSGFGKHSDNGASGGTVVEFSCKLTCP